MTIALNDINLRKSAKGVHRVTIKGHDYVQALEYEHRGPKGLVFIPIENNGQPVFSLPGGRRATVSEILRQINA